MRIINMAFIVVFVLSAALQYNDPDPYIWMPIYLYGAFLCFRAIQKNYNPMLYVAGLIVTVAMPSTFFSIGQEC